MKARVPANIEGILEPMKDVQKMIGAMLVANERAFNAHLEQMHKVRGFKLMLWKKRRSARDYLRTISIRKSRQRSRFVSPSAQ
jgi:hypothetical protein